MFILPKSDRTLHSTTVLVVTVKFSGIIFVYSHVSNVNLLMISSITFCHVKMLHVASPHDYSWHTINVLLILYVYGWWVILVMLKVLPCLKSKFVCLTILAQWVLIWFPLFTCLSLRSLNRLHCQQAVLDKLGQWHYQQVQSGWQWAGSAGDSKEGVSQRHSSGRDGWVELVTSASDCHWGLVRECGGITCSTS